MAREGFATILPQLHADILLENQAKADFFNKYIRDEREAAVAPLHHLSEQERQYVERMLTFVYREQLAQKTGVQEGQSGAQADLWNMPLDEKLETGSILMGPIVEHDSEHVTACVLEDPPLFRVTPEEVQEGAGTFVWYDGYTVAHSFLQQNDVKDYAAWYASHSYLFGLFGGLQDMLAKQTADWCAEHPGEHVVNAWVPRNWTRGMYFMNDYDPRFGDAFYNGSWMAGIDQEALLREIECPVIYLKASTNYGNDGVLYAATTDDDAARIQQTIPRCKTNEIKSGHDIHFEEPDFFVAGIDEAMAQARCN
jgi:pimeloyl-ACP methyl ester carboxylesterase